MQLLHTSNFVIVFDETENKQENCEEMPQSLGVFRFSSKARCELRGGGDFVREREERNG